MPNRVLREGIITSEPVNSLSWAEEVFYRRLHSVVDDYGRFSAHPSLLRAACYPLRLNDVSDRDVGKWLASCAAKGLVTAYEVEGKPYLELVKFGQRVRADKSKCPQPPPDCQSNDSQLSDNGQTAAPVVEVEVGDVVDVQTLSGKPDVSPLNGKKAQALEVLEFLNAETGKDYRPVAANLEIIVARLAEGYTVADMRKVVVRKCSQWKGDEKMEIYLRPSTLFNKTKLAQYSGELVVPT